ncbi:MAG: sulfatase-like hydrolase/transferase, partial [Planctomycetia bacterium]
GVETAVQQTLATEIDRALADRSGSPAAGVVPAAHEAPAAPTSTETRGQAAATAAAQAIDGGVAVQDVPYEPLRRRLLADGQVLEYRGPPRLPSGRKAAATPSAEPEPTGGAAPRASRTPPNILLIVADDLGYETLGCYGGLDFSTPHLDRLAAQGMRFGRAYASPVCTPSRMSLYTGTYVTRHGYDFVLPEHEGSREAVDFRDRWATYPQLLRAAGYQTSVSGKWQLGPLEFHPEHCRDAGFDSWCVWQIWHDDAKTERHWKACLNHDGRIRDDVADCFGPDVLADYVIDQIRAAVAAGRPFCIHHNELLPHTPVVDTPRDRREGEPKSVHRMVAYMDELCGRIMAEIDRRGIADDTIVIFTGDNGTDIQAPRRIAAGAVTGGKRDLNDSGTHVPLLVRWPKRIQAGAVADDLVDMADLFPTICELAGVELPATLDLDGISFAPRLRDGTPSAREWVTGGIGGKVSLFDGRWRLNLESRQVIDARDLPRELVVAEPRFTDEPLQRLEQAGREITSLPRTNRRKP